jgi:hypothetical protein
LHAVLVSICGAPRGSLTLVAYQLPTMFKAVVKVFALLCILFVVLYVGMNNIHEIDFNFPVATAGVKKPIHTSAALIFFGMFAVGLLAGTILAVGNGKGGKRSGGGKEK